MSKKNKNEGPQSTDQSDPVTYMRSRHLDFYSDSGSVTSVELTRGLLEYHLETITNRSQETEFAYFVRRLAEKEICPNLRPQTGPTGGGDSKADSETIPVSSEISELWIGSDPRAGEERWAFAFSAKKDWKAKVASDVRNIASTVRGYSRIYFITNQFAPDKSRAESEDSLSKETGIKVTILDRSWITKSVIENGRADIAIETLKIEELRSRVEKKLGPADLERKEELEELERAIADPGYYRGARYQLIEDALRAALLARGLGRPRTELDGLFLRADRLANNPESVKQRLRIAYNYAWTSIFWFDDYHQLNSIYNAVEAFALISDQMEDIELAQNLWMVLLGQVRRGVLSRTEAKIDSRKEELVTVLKRLATDNVRPNNALQARTSLALLSLQDAVEAHEAQDVSGLDGIWKTFNQIVTDAENLGDYPFERLAALIEELGELGIEGEEFNELFESVVAALERRRGETAGAGLLRDRGFQKLEAKKLYEAISLLGRAMERFAKREHRKDLIFCLMALSDAYAGAGLLWAARGCSLSAVERCLAYFHEEGELIKFSLSAIEQLIIIELQLGRLAHVLMGIELESALAPQLALTENRRERFREHRQLTEGLIGIALLTASLPQLRQMDFLPEALEALGLLIPKCFLLYALGYRDELRNEGFSADKWSDSDIDEFIKLAFSQPGRLQLPARPQIESDQKVTYRTTVLGCDLELEAPATPHSISVAEAVLGTIEAFFATSLNERIMPYRPTAKIRVDPASDLTQGLRVTEENIEGDAFVRVQHPVIPPLFTADARLEYRDGLMSLIARFMVHIAVIEDGPLYMSRIAGEERGLSRALLYSEVSLAQDNVFGSSPKLLLTDWTPPKGAKRFPLIRTTEWDRGLSIEQMPLPDRDEQQHPDPRNPSVFFRSKAANEKHSDRRVASKIDIPLWDRAEWRAVFYFFDSKVVPYPVLCLGFRNKEAAEKIFRAWHNQLGPKDNENRIRVTILKGIERENPAAYRVFLSTNIDPGEDSNSVVVMVGRHQTMTPTTTRNLDAFLEMVDQSGQYLLAPAHFVSEAELPDMGLGLGILKNELVVRNAWEIPINDLDSSAFTAEDDPLIPPDAKDAPVTALLALIREFPRRTKPPINVR
jgi:hypothetical protein